MNSKRTTVYSITVCILFLVVCPTAQSQNFILLKDAEHKFVSVAFSPSGKFLAVARDDNAIAVWDLKAGQKFKTFIDESMQVLCLSISKDDKTICAGTRDGSIVVWDITTGQRVLKRDFAGLVFRSVRHNQGGTWFAAATVGKSVHFWTSETPDETKEFVGHKHDVQDVVFTPDGNGIISGDFRGGIKVWKMTGEIEIESPGSVAGSICKVAVDPSGGLLAIGDSTSALRICTLPGFVSSEIRSYGDEVETVDHLAISPDGKYLVAGIRDTGEIEFWELGAQRQTATLPVRFLNEVAFSPDGETLASVDADGIKLWDMRSLLLKESLRRKQ